MKKILLTSIIILSGCLTKAQTQPNASYDNIFFNNLYPNAVFGNSTEQTHYHLISTGAGTGGSPLLDVKWWGGINMHSEGGAVKLKSAYGTLYMSTGGNTGINTEDPKATLDVRGSARINSSSEYSFIGLGQQGNDNIIADNSNDKNYGGGYFFRVHNNNATDQYVDALMIDENGNIGIGSKPTAKLDVNGSLRVASNGNSFLYNGAADLVLKAPVRGSGGRAIVHDEVNTLTLNYDGDFTGGTKIGNSTIIKNNGNASFQGKVEAKEVKVTQTPTADFVFWEDYNLPKLEDVEKHIKEKKHLPEIASAKEMEKEGVNVGEFQIKLLQKIEELTLYSIDQNKQIKKLIEDNKSMQEIHSKEIESLKAELESIKKVNKIKN